MSFAPLFESHPFPMCRNRQPIMFKITVVVSRPQHHFSILSLPIHILPKLVSCIPSEIFLFLYQLTHGSHQTPWNPSGQKMYPTLLTKQNSPFILNDLYLRVKIFHQFRLCIIHIESMSFHHLVHIHLIKRCFVAISTFL